MRQKAVDLQNRNRKKKKDANFIILSARKQKKINKIHQVGKKASVFAVSGSLLGHNWINRGSSLRQGGQLDQRDLVLLGDGCPPPALHVLRRGGRRHLPLGSHGRVVPSVPQGPGHRDPGHPPVRLHLLGGPVELHPPTTSRHWRSLSLLLSSLSSQFDRRGRLRSRNTRPDVFRKQRTPHKH